MPKASEPGEPASRRRTAVLVVFGLALAAAAALAVAVMVITNGIPCDDENSTEAFVALGLTVPAGMCFGTAVATGSRIGVYNLIKPQPVRRSIVYGLFFMIAGTVGTLFLGAATWESRCFDTTSKSACPALVKAVEPA
jgi:hypothetical protein